MDTNVTQKNTAFRRIKYLTLMQIGDSVRDLRNGNKAKLAAKTSLRLLLMVVLMAVFIAVFWVVKSLLFLDLSRDMLVTVLFVMQVVSIISCLSGMMLTLFASKENTMLLAFPCRYSEIFLSKIVVFALEEIKKNLYFLLPMLIGFGINASVGVGFWLQIPLVWLTLCLLPVFIGATLSIPAIFIKRFLQNHVWVYAIIMVVLIGSAFFGLFTFLSGVKIPIRLVAIYGEFVNGIKKGFVSINQFALFYNWVGNTLFGKRIYLYLPLLLLVLFGFAALCFVAAMPFYFKAASASNENSTTKKHKEEIVHGNVLLCILLSIVTLGIYGIYWMYILVKNTRLLQKNAGNCIREMLCLFFVPFYSWYWWYTRGEKVETELSKYKHAAVGNRIIYLILSIFGLHIISMAVMQHDFNAAQSKVGIFKTGSLFGTFFRKELKIQFRTFQSVNSMIIVVFIFPLITYIFNFLMAAINTSSMGKYMSIAFNLMIILSLLGTHNANSAASISMEGNEFAVLKTAPSNTSVIAWAKLAVTGIVNLMSLIVMAGMLLMTTRLSMLDIAMLMATILFISLGQIAWGFEFDIRKPKINEYATKGDGVTDNGNIAKAMAISFLVATLFGVFGMLLMVESYVYGWVRLLAIAAAFMVARFYLLNSNLKAYFEDIQG